MKRKTRLLTLLTIGVALGAFVLAGCQPRVAQSQSSSDAKSGEAGIVWSADIECSNCHEEEASSATDSMCLLSKHASLACTTCHADESALAAVHEEMKDSGNAPTRLRKTEVGVTVCQGCHDAASLAEKTASSAILTDAKGTVANPHAIPDNEGHAGKVDCLSCHEVHGSSGIADTAAKACSSCHHKNVYECGTCHE